jgi:hypothetical protein
MSRAVRMSPARVGAFQLGLRDLERAARPFLVRFRTALVESAHRSLSRAAGPIMVSTLPAGRPGRSQVPHGRAVARGGAPGIASFHGPPARQEATTGLHRHAN